MKKTLLSATAIAAAALAPLAHASDGTVDFAGKLVAQTCTIDINGVPAFMSVVLLPKVSTGMLTTAGETTGQTGFSIGLSNCSGAAKSAAAFFEHTGLTPIDPVTGNMKNGVAPGLATNVQLQLLDALSGNPIRIGDTGQLTSTTHVPIDASGNARLPYAVQYYATGATTAGRVRTDVYFSINYQ